MNLIDLYTNNKNIIAPKIIYNDNIDNYCKECCIEKQLIDNYYSCYICGDTTESIIVDNYVDPQERITRYPYKQKEHFRYKLMKLQGTDNQLIPQSIIDVLKGYSYDTIQELQSIMKKLKYREYFKNIIIIDYRIKGVMRHDLSTALFNKVLREFDYIQKYYYEIIDKKRQMFNYNYILFKLMILFNRPDIARNVFFIHKYDSTVKKYDEIWKYICQRSNYRYVSTRNQLAEIKLMD